MKRTKYTRPCTHCGKDFQTIPSKARQFCSNECCWAYRRAQRPTTICLICSKVFPHSPVWSPKYCSLTCRDLGNVKRETRTCPQCAKQFECRPGDGWQHCSLACGVKSGSAKQRRRETRVCPQCQQPFSIVPSKTKIYCSRACIDAFHREQAKQPFEKICAHCNDPFLCDPWRPEQEYCSQRCHMRTNAKTRRGPAHPLYKPPVELACVICGKVCFVKPSVADAFRVCSRRCGGALTQRKFPRISSIERAMHQKFIGAGLHPVQQHILGHFTFDFAFPDALIVVECDGTYWHSLPKRKRLDRAKGTYATKHGWRLIRLTEEAINTNPDDCLAVVLAAIHATPALLEAKG